MEELNDLPPVEKARALFQRGSAARREGRDPVAHGFYTQSLNLFRGHNDQQGVADALVVLADLALHYNPTDQDSHERRKLLAEEALASIARWATKRDRLALSACWPRSCREKKRSVLWRRAWL